MVGKSVLLESLKSDKVEKVLAISRNPLPLVHPKLEQLQHANFLDLGPIKDQLKGYDACFHCMGISAVGKSEEEYTKFTYDLTAHWADTLYELNPDMVFSYVSGTGSDSSERGRIMWARVKGRAENKVLNTGFKDAYAFRPGMIIPERGIKSSTGWYNAVYVMMRPFFGGLKKLKNVTTTTKIGLAMINSIYRTQELKHLENRDINQLAVRKIP